MKSEPNLNRYGCSYVAKVLSLIHIHLFILFHIHPFIFIFIYLYSYSSIYIHILLFIFISIYLCSYSSIYVHIHLFMFTFMLYFLHSGIYFHIHVAFSYSWLCYAWFCSFICMAYFHGTREAECITSGSHSYSAHQKPFYASLTIRDNAFWSGAPVWTSLAFISNFQMTSCPRSRGH